MDASQEPDVSTVAPRDGLTLPDVAGPRLPAGLAKRAGLVLRAYRSESAIYGVILVSALIAIGWENDTDAEVLGFTLGTVIVFWLAHVYAGAIAREEWADTPSRWRTIGRAVWASVTHSAGLLIAMVVPTIFLGISALGWLDEYVGYYLALWSGVAILAVIGWLASARRKSPWWMRGLSALVTASLGLLVIWLSALVH
ncbi:hypothetical protein ET445_05375 [Agromyces protaetiae]|uniref:Uncharacterized protein n=1 Tax=Agromyces protaetiae TaxID=2509455 RepID=A0A4P6FGA0_9MICO|nr:hypothetical protein [Agromyces protaetiae]QAY72857.1 hypothetical protein ET445_05375 [Agromyces protaetiae]